MNESLLKPYKNHILLCVGNGCSNEQGNAVYSYLKDRLRELNLHDGENRAARSKSTCLGVCQKGPIAVVYPAGIWYHSVTIEVIERIIQEHLLEGKIVEEFCLGRL
jgi:(2Fe-2S) ferredoxin